MRMNSEIRIGGLFDALSAYSNRNMMQPQKGLVVQLGIICGCLSFTPNSPKGGCRKPVLSELAG
jgi:hypothetical protein